MKILKIMLLCMAFSLFMLVSRSSASGVTFTEPSAGSTQSGVVTYECVVQAGDYPIPSYGTFSVTDDAGITYNLPSVQPVMVYMPPAIPTPYYTFTFTINTQMFIIPPATSYNGTVTVNAHIFYPYALPPHGAIVYEDGNDGSQDNTIQVGYTLGASCTATVTLPASGSTIKAPASFTITSDHHFDFNRLDSVFGYAPWIGYELQSTFSSGSVETIASKSMNYLLPMRLGDCAVDEILSVPESASVTGDPSITYQSYALSFYPDLNTQIASGANQFTID